MNDTRKEYVPPTAEVILLAPDEKLAAWDTGFTHDNSGWFLNTDTGASAVTAYGTFADDNMGDGFVLPRSAQSK